VSIQHNDELVVDHITQLSDHNARIKQVEHKVDKHDSLLSEVQEGLRELVGTNGFSPCFSCFFI
jgi:hypothetical protein